MTGLKIFTKQHLSLYIKLLLHVNWTLVSYGDDCTQTKFEKDFRLLEE